jgi:PDZ domain-containing protein
MKHQLSRWALVVGLLVAFWVIPTPYVLHQSGSAEKCAERVMIEGGEASTTGGFYLTTVLSLKASNLFFVLYGWLAPYTEVIPSNQVRGNLTDTQYAKLLQYEMSNSQQTAIYSALQAVGQASSIQYAGIYVKSLLEQSLSKGILAPGDLIITLDGKPMQTTSELIKYLSERKRVGDVVKIEYIHNDERKVAEVPLVSLNNGQPGLGLSVGNQIQVESSIEITMANKDIGGPSAGLMFALEIADQVTTGELTQGYTIAGTGTMDLEGNVGQIGGIEHKLRAAEKIGADLFFLPADRNPTDRNEREAKAEITKRGYNLQLVPVHSLSEALQYLQQLTPKT